MEYILYILAGILGWLAAGIPSVLIVALWLSADASLAAGLSRTRDRVLLDYIHQSVFTGTWRTMMGSASALLMWPVYLHSLFTSIPLAVRQCIAVWRHE